MALTLVTAPAETPVSLSEVKAHLRIDHEDEDDHLEILIDAATAHLDGYNGILGRALIPQTWDLHWDEFPYGPMKIPLPPLIDVNFVKYYDTGDDLQTLSPNEYEVDLKSSDGFVVPSVNGWPDTNPDRINAVQVRFQAGYSSGVPAAIKAAMFLIIADLYENREPVVIGQTVNETSAVKALLTPYRRVAF